MHPQRSRRAVLILAGLPVTMMIAGTLSGWGFTGTTTNAQSVDASATATREAEMTEIATLRTEVAALQTRVAELSVSPTPTVVPSPTATPTPVPPAPMNQPLSYRGTWTVVITDVTKSATVQGNNNSATAQGVYVVVRGTVTNNEGENARFPGSDLVLTDDRGRHYEFTSYETIMVSENFSQTFEAGVPTDAVWVFDVAPDAGDRFILESSDDPAFRVQLEIARRG